MVNEFDVEPEPELSSESMAHFSAFAPDVISGQAFDLDVWAYLAEQYDDMWLEASGSTWRDSAVELPGSGGTAGEPLPLGAGQVFTVTVAFKKAQYFEVEVGPQRRTFQRRDEPTKVPFPVQCGVDTPPGSYVGTVAITSEQSMKLEFWFRLEVSQSPPASPTRSPERPARREVGQSTRPIEPRGPADPSPACPRHRV